MKQVREYDCVLACLAMATGKDYKAIFPEDFCNEVEESKGTGKKGLHDRAFALAGLVAKQDYVSVYCGNIPPQAVRGLIWGRRALVQVPSLNYEEGSHYVYWDGHTVHDPSNLQCYKWVSQLFPEWVALLK